MEKKIKGALGAALCASLVLSGCGGGGTADETTAADTTAAEATTAAATEATTAAPAVEAAAIPTDYKYYFSFDEPDERVHYAVQDKTATPIVQVTDMEPEYVTGVKGNAVYVNGARGVKLDVNGVGDTYTVSFWVRSERSANYMPTLQYGPDMHGDATGGEHYVNFTWADWNPDGSAYPCVWSYDKLDEAKWPNWYPDEANTHVSEWCNVTMTVDPTELSDDGTLIKAHVYFNGEELIGYDSDKNIRPIHLVSKTMEPSDNFDFLLGINYWDAIMKGAFDEVYIYDYVLSAAEAKALYEAGDPTAKYTAPEREIVVTPDETAIETVGKTDFSNGWWTDWSSSYEIKDGETKIVKLKNWSSGIELWHNYVVLFSNMATDAHVDPNSVDGHVEYAAVRADAYGWLNGSGDSPIDAAAFTYTWGNWQTWLSQVMTEANVELKITRNGSDITMSATNTDYLGSANTSNVTFTVAAGASDPVYFGITGEACYIDILSVEDDVKVVADPNAMVTLGNTDFILPFWTDWTQSFEIANGTTKTVKLNNYSDGANNWDNYVVVFTNDASEAHVDPNTASDSHVEYAAIRADAYGWGDGYIDAAYETSWTDWEAWLSAMKYASVELKITRDGKNMTMDATITDKNGDTMTNKTTWTTTVEDADPMYFFITGEACMIELLSVE